MKNLGRKQFLATLTLSALLLLPITALYGQDRLLKDDYPESYTVLESDDLWNIASQFLQDPERWVEIWQPDRYLDNADLIYPGDKLRIGYVSGNPRILLARGDREEVNLGPQVRVETLMSSIPAIPLEAIENSFTRNRIVNQELYDAAPHIVANLEDNLAIGTGDEIYARGEWPPRTGSFEVYREGQSYYGSQGDVPLGIEIVYVGFATITEIEGPDLRRMLINNSSNEIRVGDRLLIREQSRINPTIFPTEPSSDISGQIVAFLGGESLASQLDTVVIDLGLRDNLEVGNILSIQRPSIDVVDDFDQGSQTFRERLRSTFSSDTIELPGEDIGTILVYKTFEQLSYAVIISSTQPAQLFNIVANP
jgi:hypothetical protein